MTLIMISKLCILHYRCRSRTSWQDINFLAIYMKTCYNKCMYYVGNKLCNGFNSLCRYIDKCMPPVISLEIKSLSMGAYKWSIVRGKLHYVHLDYGCLNIIICSPSVAMPPRKISKSRYTEIKSEGILESIHLAIIKCELIYHITP